MDIINSPRKSLMYRILILMTLSMGPKVLLTHQVKKCHMSIMFLPPLLLPQQRNKIMAMN